MMDEAQIREIVRRVTERVLGQMIAEGLFLPNQNGTLVIVPNYIPEPALLNKYIKDRFSSGVTYALFEHSAGLNPEGDTVSATERDTQQQLLSMLKFYEHVVLAMPSLHLLERIANGEDTGAAEQLVLRSILLNQKVTIILDYTPPKFKRGAFFEKLVNSITALRDMGVEIISLTPKLIPADEGLELVTEHEVLEAYQNGYCTVKCAKHALITPLARDKANELGVSIEG